MNLWTENPVTRWMAAEMQHQAAFQPSPAAMYMMLEMYYNNNGLYDAIQQELYAQAIWTPAMKGLRNPAHRIVEFYPAKIWPGALPDALPIITDNPDIVEHIHQAWVWSNWSSKKQLAARWFALYGDWFVKVVTVSDSDGAAKRVFLQQIKPVYVTDFRLDERGFVVFIRLDVPKGDQMTHTEVWDKASETYRQWLTREGTNATIEQLGTPNVVKELSEFGIDFIPFVHAIFQDVGDERGAGAFVHSLDKIDEINRQATRLHQIIFRYNKPLNAISANDRDVQGRPLPAPKVGDQDGKLRWGDDEIILLPGMSSMHSIVPSINYDAHLKSIDAQMVELEKDQPELKYYSLMEMGGNISGRAIRLMLSDAHDKVLEVRGNLETALVRANQMMLTIGVNKGLFPGTLGSYERGDFDHSFGRRDVFGTSGMDAAEEIAAYVTAGLPLITVLRNRGWDEEQIENMIADQRRQRAIDTESLGQALLNAQRKFDSGT